MPLVKAKMRVTRVLLGYRYNAERLSNNMVPTTGRPLKLEKDVVLEEGYNPHMSDAVSSRNYISRPHNVILNVISLNTQIYIARLLTQQIHA